MISTGNDSTDAAATAAIAPESKTTTPSAPATRGRASPLMSGRSSNRAAVVGRRTLAQRRYIVRKSDPRAKIFQHEREDAKEQHENDEGSQRAKHRPPVEEGRQCGSIDGNEEHPRVVRNMRHILLVLDVRDERLRGADGRR